MTCPLGKIACQSGAYTTVTKCEREICSWWDEGSQKCSVLVLALAFKGGLSIWPK